MLVHGSGPTLTSRRMGLTVQFCPTNIKLDRPSNYEETIKHTGDFRKPILVAGEDTFGELESRISCIVAILLSNKANIIYIGDPIHSTSDSSRNALP